MATMQRSINTPIRLYMDDMNMRRTARHLGIHHSTMSDWVKEHVSYLPQAPQSKKVKPFGIIWVNFKSQKADIFF